MHRTAAAACMPSMRAVWGSHLADASWSEQKAHTMAAATEAAYKPHKAWLLQHALQHVSCSPSLSVPKKQK